MPIRSSFGSAAILLRGRLAAWGAVTPATTSYAPPPARSSRRSTTNLKQATEAQRAGEARPVLDEFASQVDLVGIHRSKNAERIKAGRYRQCSSSPVPARDIENGPRVGVFPSASKPSPTIDAPMISAVGSPAPNTLPSRSKASSRLRWSHRPRSTALRSRWCRTFRCSGCLGTTLGYSGAVGSTDSFVLLLARHRRTQRRQRATRCRELPRGLQNA